MKTRGCNQHEKLANDIDDSTYNNNNNTCNKI